MAPKTGSLNDRVTGDLQAVILLAGKVRPSPLSARIGRSILDLPLDAERTLLDLWCQEVSDLSRALGSGPLTMRVVVDQSGHMPSRAHVPDPAGVRLIVERDPNEYRGTAGLIKDLASVYPESGLVLVGSAIQLPLEPLPTLTEDLSAEPDGISIVAHSDGSLAGMMMLRCRSLAVIPEVGFVDFKEQALPAIGKEHAIRVIRRDQPTGMPIRTLSDYVDALRVHHQGTRGVAALENPFAERWNPVFSLVEDGASVSPSARLQDSVVLRGGVVEDDAVVVRSVVCPGGVVRRRQRVLEEIVSVEAT